MGNKDLTRDLTRPWLEGLANYKQLWCFVLRHVSFGLAHLFDSNTELRVVFDVPVSFGL